VRTRAELLSDPLNRTYRYPAARALFRLLGWLPITPNQVTLVHTLVGIAAAMLIALGRHLLLAFVLLELRMILDCYDGVLARAKRLSSPRGRALDELGDAIAYEAIVLAIGWRVAHTASVPLGIALFVGLGVTGAICAHAYDFYKRRLTGILNGEPDPVARELAEKRAAIARGGAPWIVRFGAWFDGWQVRLFEPRAPLAVDARERSGALVAIVSLLSWDNALAILHVGVATDRLAALSCAAIAWGVVLLALTLLFARRALEAS
jgi:phosphatidylglycerophosphate synthase